MPLNETFQETIKTAQELHNRHIRQLKGLPSAATTTTATAFADPINNNNNTNDLSNTALLSSSDSDPSLVSISSHHLISEATTRLLRAETELGLLKLVMAQNQSEICGLEEDVLRAQYELKTHRQVFESLLELHQLGFEAQIREDQCQIKGLEGQVKRLEEEKEEAERVVKKLEEGLAEKEKMLDKKRDTYHIQEQDLIQGPVRDLEAEIELLKGELVAQEVRMIQTEEEGSQMTEFLERQHRKVTAGLKASLIKAHRSNIRLQKEVSGLAKKMVTIEGLNDEYTEQTSRDRAQLSALQQQTRDLQALLDNAATSSSSSSTGSTITIQQQNELKATITSLETQIEDLSTSLRLKQEELDQALEETERLALKLDHDLAHQQSTHVLALSALTEKHNLQAQRERACQSASVTLFQNMVIKLQAELGDTQEKLRDTTLCWGHTKEQLQKCEQSYRRRKKDLEETTRNLRELEETMARLGDAIGMLEYEKEANMVLVRTLEERDREMRDMEYRLKVLEDERD
jgi:chromosome segregation ATPase